MPMPALRVSLATFLLSTAAVAGPIDPPAGPVASTMKSLDTIEPRRCLNDLPPDEGAIVLVTEPGQYFMRADIVAGPGQHGVRIVTSGRVSIDLNGFSIRGETGSQNGIDMVLAPQSPPSSLHVRCGDGSCRGSINGFGGDGVFTSDVRDVRCENFDTTNHLGNGLHHLHAENVIHRDIAARNCGGNGYRSACGRSTGKRQHKAVSCISTGNGGDGISIEPTMGVFDVFFEDIVCTQNSANGVHIVEPLPLARSATATETVVCKMQRVELALNGGSGVLYELPVGSKSSVLVSDSSSTGNVGDGFALRASGPGDVHFGSITVHDRVRYSGNGASGLVSDNPVHVESSTMSENALYGLDAQGGDPNESCVVMHVCHLISNGGGNGGGGALLRHGRFSGYSCVVSDNEGTGIETGDGCLLLTDCSVNNNQGDGVLTNGTLNVVSSNFRRNTGSGVRCVNGECVADDMVCEFNGSASSGGGAVFTDCPTVTLRRCVFNDNTGNGVTASSTVGPIRWMAPEMVLSRNSGHGAQLDNITGGHLERCVTSGNGGTGILIGMTCTKVRVDRCHATDDGAGGIWVLGTGNIIVGCTATANPVGAFDVRQGNASGPIISAGELASSCNPNANVIY
ncbi:MAG: right-handed parallel beta-helix repeat-containing protein [Planctomycetota bacterium]